MSKVWIVFAGAYSDRHTVAVLDNKADMEIIHNAFASADIEEWEIGPDAAPDLSKISGLKRYDVCMLHSGEVQSIQVKQMDCYDHDDEWESPETTWYIDHYRPSISVVCWAKDEEAATKIAGEVLTMTLTRGDWDRCLNPPSANNLGPVCAPPGVQNPFHWFGGIRSKL